MISLVDVKLSDTKIIDLVRYCSQLRILLLSGCRQLTDLSLVRGITPHARSLYTLRYK